MTIATTFDNLAALWIVARRCLWIAVVYAAVAALVSRTSLGFEWIISSTYDVFWLVPMLVTFFISYQTYTAALYIAENPPGTPALAFAQQAIPDLVFLSTLFAVPLLLQFDAGKLKSAPEVWKFASVQISFGCVMWIGTIFVLHFATPGKRWWLRFIAPACGIVAAWAIPAANPVLCFLTILVISWTAAYWTAGVTPSGRPASVLALGVSLLVGRIWWVQAGNPSVGIGNHIGPLASISFAVAGIIAVLVWYTFVWRLLSRNTWWALFGRGLLILAVLMAGYRILTGSYNEAEIHLADRQSVPPQSTLDGFIRNWLSFHPPPGVKQPENSKPYPVILVAAEGGGIRAAYWTATALAQLEDTIPGFSDHILYLSGVSGGSVGVSIFAALLRDAPTVPKASCAAGGYKLLACAQSVAGADLLSAPLYGMLATDLLSGLTRGSDWPDRSRVLDTALETAWTDALGTLTMSQPFSNLWSSGAGNIPLITPNLTSASSGGRIVLSPVSHTVAAPGIWLHDAARRMNLSSATLASARFPAISPTALIHDSGKLYRTVDGGYADNSGTASVHEVLESLLTAARDLKRPVLPVVVLLRNGVPGDPAEPSAGGLRSQVIGTFVDPLGTLDLVRGGASSHNTALLRKRIQDLGGVFEDRISLREEFALTWMLSSLTRKRIDDLRDAATAEASPCLRSAIAGKPQGCQP